MDFIPAAAAPWRSRPAAQVRVGRSAEAALRASEGRLVSVDAFEVGAIQIPHRGWKIAAFIVLAPLWIPLFFALSVLMIIPSWIYFPIRTYREWDKARSLGVSAGMMIFGVVLVFGFGIIGGIVMTLIVLGKLVHIGNVVIVARTADRVALLYQRMPMFNFPEFWKIEFYPASSLTQGAASDGRKIFLSLQCPTGVKTILVRRIAAWATGSPEINDENLRIMLQR